LSARIQSSAPHVVVCDARDRYGTVVSDVLLSTGARPGPVVVRTTLHPAEVRGILALISAGWRVRICLPAQSSDLATAVQSADSDMDPVLLARMAILRWYASGSKEPNGVIVASALLGYPRQPVSAPSLSCSMSQRSLERSLSNARLPSPRALLAWSCCLHVAWLLEVARWSTKHVARLGGFSGTQSLSHFVERHAGHPPIRLSREIGFKGLCQAWAGQVTDY
jgi:hypothetical protein